MRDADLHLSQLSARRQTPTGTMAANDRDLPASRRFVECWKRRLCMVSPQTRQPHLASIAFEKLLHPYAGTVRSILQSIALWLPAHALPQKFLPCSQRSAAQPVVSQLAAPHVRPAHHDLLRHARRVRRARYRIGLLDGAVSAPETLDFGR